MRKFIKRLDWFAIASVIFLIGTFTVAIGFPPVIDAILWVTVLGFAAITCAVFSMRQMLIQALSE